MIRRNKLDIDIMRITTDKRIHIFYDFALYLSWSPLEHVCSFITKSLSFNIEIPIKIPLQSHWTVLRIIDPWKHLSKSSCSTALIFSDFILIKYSQSNIIVISNFFYHFQLFDLFHFWLSTVSAYFESPCLERQLKSF